MNKAEFFHYIAATLLPLALMSVTSCCLCFTSRLKSAKVMVICISILTFIIAASTNVYVLRPPEIIQTGQPAINLNSTYCAQLRNGYQECVHPEGASWARGYEFGQLWERANQEKNLDNPVLRDLSITTDERDRIYHEALEAGKLEGCANNRSIMKDERDRIYIEGFGAGRLTCYNLERRP